MIEKFFMKIDAESPDGEAVRCETQIKVACTSEMAISVMANLMRQDAALKEIFTKALIMSLTGSVETQELSDEEYAKRTEGIDDENIEL